HDLDEKAGIDLPAKATLLLAFANVVNDATAPGDDLLGQHLRDLGMGIEQQNGQAHMILLLAKGVVEGPGQATKDRLVIQRHTGLDLPPDLLDHRLEKRMRAIAPEQFEQ